MRIDGDPQVSGFTRNEVYIKKTLDRHEDKIENLEDRCTALETKIKTSEGSDKQFNISAMNNRTKIILALIGLAGPCLSIILSYFFTR